MIAFRIDPNDPTNQTLDDRGQVGKESPDLTTFPANCNGNGGTTLKFSGLQWHRTSPVLNQAQTFFFVTNRDDSGGDLHRRLAAFSTVDVSGNPPTTLTGASLADCVEADRGLTAPPAYARVPCTGCCGAGTTQVDRIFVGDRENSFYAFDFCDGVSDPNDPGPPRFVQAPVFKIPLVGGDPLNIFRTMGAVALELGTVYVFDEPSDNIENLYAFDIQTGKKKWVYESGDSAYGTTAACKAAGVGNKNCYPAPIPYILDIDPEPCADGSSCVSGQCTNGATCQVAYPVSSDGCFDGDSITLLLGYYKFSGTAEYASATIDPGAPDFRLTPPNIDAVNLTTGKHYKWGCYVVCGGIMDLAPGQNDIVLTMHDNAGKDGAIRITINPAGSCP